MSTIKSSTTTTTAYSVTADTTGTLVIQTGATPTTAVTVGTDQSVTFAQSANLPNTFGFKNRIINGAMVIDQRNAGVEVNPAVNGTYYLDRWYAGLTVAGKFKIGQNAGSVTPPVGFINYLGCTSLSAYTVGTSEAFQVLQRIEGLNIADLAWGTASAATVTLSFWVYSSLTGTFGGCLRNSAANRSYPFSYTISSASTWEQKSITIAGDTTGTWLTTNGTGIITSFSLGTGATLSGTAGSWSANNYSSATGAVSVVGTNGATFYITGVQLEKGSTATSFDYRPYGTELQLCQRYYEGQDGTTGNRFIISAPSATAAGVYYNWVNLSVQKRIAPTVALVNQSYNSGNSGSSSNPSVTGFLAQYTVTLAGSYMFSGYTASSEL